MLCANNQAIGEPIRQRPKKKKRVESLHSGSRLDPTGWHRHKGVAAACTCCQPGSWGLGFDSLDHEIVQARRNGLRLLAAGELKHHGRSIVRFLVRSGNLRLGSLDLAAAKAHRHRIPTGLLERAMDVGFGVALYLLGTLFLL